MGCILPEFIISNPANKIDTSIAAATGGGTNTVLVPFGSVTGSAIFVSTFAGDDLLTTAVKCNVMVQLSHLRTYPAVAAAEERGELELHGWFYRFETGATYELDGASRQFVSVDEKFEDELPVV